MQNFNDILLDLLITDVRFQSLFKKFKASKLILSFYDFDDMSDEISNKFCHLNALLIREFTVSELLFLLSIFAQKVDIDLSDIYEITAVLFETKTIKI